MFTYVPITRKEFEMLANKSFLKLLENIGIITNVNKGILFPRIHYKIDREISTRGIDNFRDIL